MAHSGSHAVLRVVASPTANAGRSVPIPGPAGNAATLKATTQVLCALEGVTAGHSLAAIALRAGVPKPKVEVVLAALEAERFVERVPAGQRFRISSSLLRIAASAL